ncbi:C40 family peptidase [Parasphingopyxis algicola]|uniref:peptidoglycan endopeptidase n=1 Tax=Parasphingopyxis algicola TaxID=2026624 RepID=UPI0015A4143E|nr:peptidoglycan endopeptidase [Parasphingopyxis algicola]QLC23662.1 C40 family peptidase [Parasphingopyxis algicola]
MQPDEARAARIVSAARACIGVRFRVQGRDPETGLDCVGLAAISYRAAGAAPRLPAGYGLRGGDIRDVGRWLEASGLVRIADAPAGAGDLLLLAPGSRQLHLAVHSGTGFVHADLGLRRVVETPGDPPWPLLGSWRWHPETVERNS